MLQITHYSFHFIFGDFIFSLLLSSNHAVGLIILQVLHTAATWCHCMLKQKSPGVSFITLRTHKTGLERGVRHFPCKVVIFKNKLDGRMCATACKLWSMHTHIWETRGIGDTDGEVVNWSQIVEMKCEKHNYMFNVASHAFDFTSYHVLYRPTL